MRIEIILFLVAAAWIAHIYTEGKYLKQVMNYKKEIKMAGIFLGAVFLWWLFKKNPVSAKNMIMTSNEYIKYMPIDKGTSSVLSPILNFTSRQMESNDSEYSQPIVNLQNNSIHGGGPNAEKMLHSGKRGTKRSVSETKKKFVASRQSWKCGDCQTQLNAWFEVDHKVRLEYGGSNHVDNLVALCRECHGKKTTIENL